MQLLTREERPAAIFARIAMALGAGRNSGDRLCPEHQRWASTILLGTLLRPRLTVVRQPARNGHDPHGTDVDRSHRRALVLRRRRFLRRNDCWVRVVRRKTLTALIGFMQARGHSISGRGVALSLC